MTDKSTLLTYGHGPRKVIIMNGWLGLARHWLPMLEAMPPEQFEFVVFEYRGYGSRQAQPGTFQFTETASDVAALADTLGWASFSMVGHSMGGMAMQRVALQMRDRVQGLLGIAPVSAAGSNMDATRRAFFESAVNDVSIRQKIFELSTGQRLPSTWAYKMSIDSQENNPLAMQAYLNEWASQGFADQVAALSLPVKVLVGEFDPGINALQAQNTWQQHYPHAEIEVIPQTGHYPMQELPLFVAARAQAWLCQ